MNKYANSKIKRIWIICIKQIHCLLNRKLEIFIAQTKDDLLECSKDLDVAGFGVIGTFHFLFQNKWPTFCELYICNHVFNAYLVGYIQPRLRPNIHLENLITTCTVTKSFLYCSQFSYTKIEYVMIDF